MTHEYDVIVIGAGPSGATLAYELARRGIDVTVLEKELLPRYKCCAGGVTVRTLKLLGFDISEVVEDEISGANVTFNGNSSYQGHYDRTLIYTVMRDRFDHFLVKRAESAGAIVLQGQGAKGIRFNHDSVDVSTASDDFHSRYVVGADGARSVVTRCSTLKRTTDYIAAIQAEVMVSRQKLSEWKSKIGVGLGYVRGGYAWVFPKLNHLSIGIACLVSKSGGLKESFQKYLSSLNLDDFTIIKWGGGLLPICEGEVVAAGGRAIVVGDAAGLVDPLTGEGIYNAVLSARLAAPVIEKALSGREGGLNEYQKAIEREMLPEIKVARSLFRIIVQSPSILVKLLARDERIWRGCCYLVRGEINYTTVKQKLGAFGEIFALLS